MKKFLACVLAVAMCAGLSGCGTSAFAQGRAKAPKQPDEDAAGTSATGDVPVPVAVDDGDVDAVPAAVSSPSDAGDGSAADGIVLAVKSRLGLDTDRYGYFRCESDEDPLRTCWTLHWSADDGDYMRVYVDGGGVILDYEQVDDDAGVLPYGSTERVHFPAGNAGSAAKAARAFAVKCLEDGETLELDDEPAYTSLGIDSYRFRGRILLNGLPAGVSCSVTVRASDNRVTGYDRTDWRGLVTDGVPSSDASVGEAAAAEKLAGTLSLEAEYVLPDDGSKRAYLIYRPVEGDTYYVDAVTGELVDLSEIARRVNAPLTFSSSGPSKDMNGIESAVADSVMAEGAYSLTGAESAGTARFDDAMDREALDAAAREHGALGLGSYELAGVGYSVSDLSDDGAEDLITARLNYSRTVAGQNWTRTVTLDARSGEVLAVFSSMYPGGIDEARSLRKTSEADAKKAAGAFLSEIRGDAYSRCGLYATDMPDSDSFSLQAGFTYHQKENGYYYHGNQLEVRIDMTDGSVSYYGDRFDDGVTFESADGIIGPEEAVAAWAGTYGTVLQYVQVPFAVDANAPGYEVLKDTWVSYLYKLELGYALYRDGTYTGIRASDGTAVKPSWSDDAGCQYDDVDGGSARGRMILELARYGIGLSYGSFGEDEALTDADLEEMLVGLSSGIRPYAVGYAVSATDAGREPVRLTSGEAVDMIVRKVFPAEMLDWSGMYGAVYTDWDRIPAGLKGSAAVAAASGMTDGSGAFGAGNPVTRGEAAEMIYRFLSR